MTRRDFLAGSTAAVALSSVPAYADEFADRKPRVGLIGSGWYGKCDLFRLIQVAPVEVVSLCDVDRQMLAEAAEMVAGRQASRKTPRTYTDYREMLREKDLDIVLVDTPDHWHALPMIAAVQAGADVTIDEGTPMRLALFHGEAAAAQALAQHGARLDLCTAAGLGRLDLVREWWEDGDRDEDLRGAVVPEYGYAFSLTNDLPHVVYSACDPFSRWSDTQRLHLRVLRHAVSAAGRPHERVRV